MYLDELFTKPVDLDTLQSPLERAIDSIVGAWSHSDGATIMLEILAYIENAKDDDERYLILSMLQEYSYQRTDHYQQGFHAYMEQSLKIKKRKRKEKKA